MKIIDNTAAFWGENNTNMTGITRETREKTLVLIPSVTLFL